jgi:gliding motility-associated protein GldC
MVKMKKMENRSEIKFTIELDENQVPEQMVWEATESKEEGKKPCTAILVSVWNGVDKSTLRIDLWTKEMPIDEMKIFFHQSLLSMADTFEKATGETAVTGDLRDYCHHFAEKMKILENQ